MLLLLALLQTPPPKPAQEPSLFDRPQFVEGKFEATVDSGAHASAGSAARTTIPLLSVLQLPVSRRSTSANPQANAAHTEALILEGNRQPIEAAKLFARAAQLDPSPSHILDASVHLLSHGAPSQAAKLLTQGLLAHPRDTNLQLALGLARFALAQYEQAKSCFLSALQQSPSDPRPLDALAFIIEAAPSLASTLIEPLSQSPFHQALAILRALNTKPGVQQAEALLQKAISQNPNLDKAHFELARLYLDQQRNTNALGELLAVIQLNPNHELAHFRLAQLYQRTQRKAEADIHFAIFRRLHSKRLEAEEAERKARILFSEAPAR